VPSSAIPAVSVVLCTWNRATLLEAALEALTRQDAAPAHEIVVVDNNSTDDTRRIVERFAATHEQLRYVFEPAAGLSHARNTGIAHTSGPIVAFTDDDVRVPADWLRNVVATGEQYQDAAYFGGPVRPIWTQPPPVWLIEDAWSGLGVQSYGDRVCRMDARRPQCLIGANLVIRRRTLDAIGGFDPAVQRVQEGIGSTEDDEYQRRIWMTGAYGIYEPRLSVDALVTADRLTRSYHRRWHFGHGRHIARMRLPDMERSRRHVLGVPIHLLRQTYLDAAWTLGAWLRGDAIAAFRHELHLWFKAGFIRERLTAARPGNRAQQDR
jgi:glucosyl-dolichyl phosphate glucuronosyltransferase